MAGGHGLATAGANNGAGMDAQPDHLNNKCSYPAYVGEKLYEYWAIIEMLYLLSTDANARAQFVENMQGSAAYHAMVSMGAGQMAADQNMAAGSLALWEYFGVVKKGTSEAMLKEGMASAELSREHGKIAFDKIAASLKEYVDAILKRYDDCGLLYAIATLSTDGVFFVADLAIGAGAGALAVKGLKFVALRVAKTGAIAVTATSSAGGILRRTFSRQALEAKYGNAQRNHMGALHEDKNFKPKPGEKDKKPDKKKTDEKPDGSYRDPKDPAGVRRAADGEAMVQDPKTGNWNRISDSSSAAKGNFGETMADKAMADAGYAKLNGNPTTIGQGIDKGIDGVYYNPNGSPKYIVGDAKFGSAGLSTLSDGTKQMSQAWIDGRLGSAVSAADAARMRMQGYGREILKVDKNGKVTRAPLGDIKFRGP
jgi:hypothetical protein